MTESWRLDGTTARCACGPLAATLDLERPARGLRQLRVADQPLAGWLMGVNVADGARRGRAVGDEPWSATDVYVRGGDLCATYHQPLGEPFIIQITWRVLASQHGQAAALETMLSINTRQWEAYPGVRLGSALPTETVREKNGGVIFKSPHEWAYVETALPTDFTPDLPAAERSELRASRWTFDEQFMERGVIRRLRLRGAFAPIVEAEAAVEQLRAALVAEPPPLTA